MAAATIMPFFVYLILQKISPKYSELAGNICILYVWFIFGIMIFKFFVLLLPKRKLLALGLSMSIVGVFGEIYQVSQIEF